MELEFSISACSRDPRPNEEHGKDYYFLGVDGFKAHIESDAFVEWEEVYTNNYYGTLRSELTRIWEAGKTVIFDVDVIGGLNLKSFFGEQALAVFVQPPSYDILEERLRARSTETDEKIAMRLAKAKEELEAVDALQGNTCSASNSAQRIIGNMHRKFCFAIDTNVQSAQQRSTTSKVNTRLENIGR